MKYSSQENSWVFARPKDAVLYFRRVHILRESLLGNKEEVEALAQIADDKPLAGDSRLGLHPAPGVFLVNSLLIRSLEAGARAGVESAGMELPQPPVHPDDPTYPWLYTLWTLTLSIESGLAEKGSLIIPSTSVLDDDPSEPSMMLSGLRLIDTSRLSWEHILELRQDRESMSKLRRLRLFLCEEYQNEDREFVKDDLLQRVDDYEKTANKWGTELREACISMMLGNDVALAAAISLGSLLADQPVMALSATAPIFIQFGKIGLEIKARRRDDVLNLKHNPIAFLLELKDKTDESRGRTS